MDGDDGLPTEDVDVLAKEKPQYPCRYIDISRAVRSGRTSPGKAGDTFIDPVCGPGHSKVRETGEWIDGGCSRLDEELRGRRPVHASLHRATVWRPAFWPLWRGDKGARQRGAAPMQ